MPAEQARNNFGDVLSRVCHGAETIAVTRHQRPAAEIVDPETYEICKVALQKQQRSSASISLSPRHIAVLRRLASGETGGATADAEGVGLRTVEDFVAGLKVELEARNLCHLGRIAAELNPLVGHAHYRGVDNYSFSVNLRYVE